VATPELLGRLGLLVERGFLGPAECARLRAEMATGEGLLATVHEGDGRFVADPSVRRARLVRVSADAVEPVLGALEGLCLRAAQHFGVFLTSWQPPQFLVYGTGDFYHPHPDSSADPDAAVSVRARKVSVVVFLNDAAEAPGPGVYGGGALTFWGLLRDRRLDRHGVPLSGETGLAVAFPSHLTHGVEAVTHGERFTIATWLV
jgi:predicted 2-oxoglutarate/Fe(II)-dependent dioxygenase YbiX